MKKTKLIKNICQSFRDFNYKSMLIIAIDTLFFLFAVFIIKRWAGYVERIILMIPAPEQLLAMPLEHIKEIMSPDPKLLLISSFLIMAAILLITFVISRSAVWLLSRKKKITIKEFAKFSLISLCWYLIVLIPSAALFIILKQGTNLAFLAVIILLLMHYSISLHLSLTKVQKFRQIIMSIKTGTKKIHLFLLSYLVFAIALFMIHQVWWIYRYAITDYTIPRLILTSAAMCWARYVMLRIIR